MFQRYRKELIVIGVAILVLAFVLSIAQVLGRGNVGSVTSGGFGAVAPSMGVAVTEEGVYVGRDAAMQKVAYDGDEYAANSAATIGIMPPSPEPSAGPSAGEADQRIIRDANLSMVVDDVVDATSRIAQIAESRDGYVQHSSVNERGDGTFAGSITVRVPTDAYTATMADIRALANVVPDEYVSAQDVTEQYTDLEARLRNAKAQEAAYLDILARARTVEDTLAVQRELSNIRYQIESLEGQRKYLENRTAYATISVSLEEEPMVRVPTKAFRPGSAIVQAFQALVQVLQAMVIWVIWILIIGVGTLVPFILVWWLIIWAVMRAWRAWRGRGMMPPRR